MEPNYVKAHRQLAEAYLGKGMHPQAIAEMRNFLAQAGDTAGAKRYLAEIKPANSPLLEGIAYAGLPDKDKAFDLLNESLRAHTISPELGFLVEFDPLRNDPRFDQLMHNAGVR